MSTKAWNFEVETVTPAFMSGADPQKAEIRAQSIRGLLRFWFRAVPCASLDPDDVREAENLLFGSAEKGGGQSKVLVRVEANFTQNRTGLPTPKQKYSKKETTKGREIFVDLISYLGYGPFNYDKNAHMNVSQRPSIPTGTTINLSLVQRAELSPSQKSGLGWALWSLFTLGGIGSRSRRGFGSLCLIKGWDVLEDMLNQKGLGPVASSQTWAKAKGMSAKTKALPPYTRISQGARLFQGAAESRWEDAMGWLGLVWKECRTSLEKRHEYEKRIVLGAPLMVEKEEYMGIERRGSPYFFHVCKKGDNGFVPQILFLPARYHPEHDLDGRLVEATAEVNEKIKARKDVTEL